ncbi:RAMP superfamily CRISPR-associated protein [Enterocloster citroniae]|uniref:RAMP superfamily CRISPR-associated protein n=1 Tax=Enterocloster citroniae TaxID=358743 RepID=UPI001D076273|nr:RAMP superfamily CRISPR-associated protein [Enterocloster citroniae]MCB7068084.1 RAMP superfamily CRISPR-associated protein [Enterocloster citroniae]
MKQVITIRVKTLSNLFIGGVPMPFEIGGIDQWTAIDEEGYPCIPASTLKGALRAIIMEDQSVEASKIGQWYAELLKKEWEENREKIQQCIEENEARIRIEKRYMNAIEKASASDLFGIREFNNTPKLLFNDLRLKEEQRILKDCFSIDTKTSINCEGAEPKSNPRTYKAARAGLEFEGQIELYRFGQIYLDKNAVETFRTYIINNLKKFNDGIYRIGNSKSRGYGKIYVSVIEEGGGEGCYEKL